MTSSADLTKLEEADSGNDYPRPAVDFVGDQASGTVPTAIRELLLDAFEAIPEGIAIFDDQDRFVLWNRRYAEMYEKLGFSLQVGKPFEELLREGLSRGLYPNAIGREDEWLASRMERHRRPLNEHEQMLASGKWVRVQEQRSQGGGSVGIRIDISDLKKRQTELQNQKSHLNAAIENMSQGLLMFDGSGRLVVHNTRYAQMYCIPDRAIKPGMTVFDIVKLRERHGTFRGDPDEHCKQLLAAIADGRTYDRVIELPDGRCVHAISTPSEGGGWVITHEDITEHRRAQHQIEYLAQHDSLTDLANRSRFNECLMRALTEAEASGEQVGLLCLDVDRFKEINDVFGHVTGDTYLKTLAGRIKEAAGDSIVGRLGGDEFSVLVRCADETRVRSIAEGILQVACQEVVVDDHLIKSGISIGIAISPLDGDSGATLLANADAALYRAKAEGRGNIRRFDSEMDRQLREKHVLLQQLRSAVARNEFELHYQPQVRTSGGVVGFEALIRWKHPSRGLLAPNIFVPLAEESGAIVEIGEWALRTACAEANRWAPELRISANLSAVQFRHGDLVRVVHQALIDSGLPPSRLQLEITESVLIDDFNRALSILRRLKAIGVSIAMDDFGTGYSSLSYLQSFPFDMIKIDRSFVSRLTTESQSVPIVRAIVGLAKGLGLPVTAEGVETREQLEILTKLGCQEAQGFLFGRPRPIATYNDLIYGSKLEKLKA